MPTQTKNREKKRNAYRLRFFIVLLSIIGLWVALAWNSIRQPYIPSRSVYSFLFYYFPAGLTLAVATLFTFYRREGKNGWATIYSKAGNGWSGIFANVKGIFSVLILALIISFADYKILASPTHYFAKESFVSVERVAKIGTFRFRIEGRSNIHLISDLGETASFIWPTSDPALAEFKSGDCLRLEGKQWIFGRWVEHIQRSDC